MQQIRLAARRRSGTGKGSARALRRAGSIPAILYGREQEPVPLEVDTRTIQRLLASGAIENALINLDFEEDQATVMLKEVQRDPVSYEILHADFLRISLTEAVSTHVPIVLDGSPLGVREEGGVLEFVHRELALRCLPTEIPQHVEIAVTTLAIGDSIHVGDIQLPEGFELEDEPETLILSIRPPTVRVEEAEEEVEEGEQEPEVISRRAEEDEE